MAAPKNPNNGAGRKKRATLADPFTLTNRGPITANIRYMPGPTQDSEYVYVELVSGARRARSPFSSEFDHASLVRDLLVMLGFQPTVTTGQGPWYDETGNVGEDEDQDEQI